MSKFVTIVLVIASFAAGSLITYFVITQREPQHPKKSDREVPLGNHEALDHLKPLYEK